MGRLLSLSLLESTLVVYSLLIPTQTDVVPSLCLEHLDYPRAHTLNMSTANDHMYLHSRLQFC